MTVRVHCTSLSYGDDRYLFPKHAARECGRVTPVTDPGTRHLIVVDLSEASRTRTLVLWLAKQLLRIARVRAAAARAAGATASEPLLLIISPGGSAASRTSWGTTEVTTPLEVLQLSERSDEAQLGVYDASRQLCQEPFLSATPSCMGVSLAPLSRTISIAYLRTALLLIRAADALLEREAVARVTVVTSDPSLADGVRLAGLSHGVPVNTHAPRLVAWLHAALTRARVSLRPFARQHRGSSTQVEARELKRCDVLVVSESTPMHRMFDVVESALAERAADLQITRIQFGGPENTTVPERNRTILRFPRPDDAQVTFAVHGAPDAVRNASQAAATLQARIMERDVSIPTAELFSRLSRVSFDPQCEHLRHASELLEALRPRLLVVGNDRWWIGQAFVQLARQRSIPTVMLQDGVATEGAEWFFAEADVMCISSDFLASRLEAAGASGHRIEVVGQPRYDRILAANRGAPGAPEEFGTPYKVLFATQTMQDADFVRLTLDALLRVPGVDITLRPHPSEDPRLHMALASSNPQRVTLEQGDDIFDSLTHSDLLVCQSSTAVLEAAVLGVPAVTVNFTGLPDLAPYARHGLATSVTSPEELTSAVSRILSDPAHLAEVRRLVRDAPGLARILGPTDGKATERTVELLLSLIGAEATL